MTMDEKIKRINELYHKSKGVGLTEEEKVEQAQLRKDYVASIRGNLRSQLESMTIQYEDGSREKVSDRRRRVEGEKRLEELEEKEKLEEQEKPEGQKRVDTSEKEQSGQEDLTVKKKP